ncbi:MAG: hypothetical protein PF485_14920 [Bacteroidales bacterium]|jgi:microcystin-dependent protein|nr:hypothetical protein [Bacteroidales bacterium]
MRNFTRLILVVTFFSLSTITWAQVGIGIADPNPAAVLDLTADSTGVLFPRINNSAVLDTATGLFFYATDDNRFYFFNGTNWQCVNPFISSAPGNARLNGDLTMQGNVVVEPESKFIGYGTVPVGGIMMWSGDPTILPAEWALCDGNGTYKDISNIIRDIPDLRGKFVVGFDPDLPNYNSTWNEGGQKSFVLTKDNIPEHNHTINHNHSLNDPGHIHQIHTSRDGGNGEISKQDSHNSVDKPTKSATTGITINAYNGNSGIWGTNIYTPPVTETNLEGNPCKYNITKVGCTDLRPYTNYLMESNCNGFHPFIKPPNPPGIDNPDYFASTTNEPLCKNADYNPDYGDITEIEPGYWGVVSVDNRPPYFVVAYIIRVK